MKQNLFNHVVGFLTILSKIISFLMFITIGVSIATFYPEHAQEFVKYGEDVALAVVVFFLGIGLVLDAVSWIIEKKILEPMEAAKGILTP